MGLRLLTVFILLTAILSADPLSDAIDLFKAHRVPEARPLFAEIVKATPTNIEARLYLARCMNVMHDRDTAVDLLEKTVEMAPKNDVAMAEYGAACMHRAEELGISFRALSLARRGRNALEAAVEMKPGKIIYREGLVDFYRQAPGIAGGSLKRAHAHAEIVAKLDPLRGKLLLASLAAQEDHPDEALAICREVIAEHPDNYLALYTFARAATDAGVSLAEAEGYLRHCLTLTPSPSEPDHAGAYYRLGMAAEKSGRTADARASYKQALEIQPGFAKAAEALAALK